MDVTITNGLEGVRQYFQGLPTATNSPDNSSIFSADQYTDNVENNIWSGNVKIPSSDIPTDEQSSKTNEKSNSSFNQVVNSTENSFSLFNSNNSCQSHEQHQTVLLPKHEMRPHNHEIWKPSYEQRTPDINDGKNSNNINVDKSTENVSMNNSNYDTEQLSQTNKKIQNQSPSNNSIHFTNQLDDTIVKDAKTCVIKTPNEGSCDGFKQPKHTFQDHLNKNKLLEATNSEIHSLLQEAPVPPTSIKFDTISTDKINQLQEINLPLKNANTSEPKSLKSEIKEPSVETQLLQQQPSTRPISHEGQSKFQDVGSQELIKLSPIPEVRSSPLEIKPKIIEIPSSQEMSQLSSPTSHEIRSKELRPVSREIKPLEMSSVVPQEKRLPLVSQDTGSYPYDRRLSSSHETRIFPQDGVRQQPSEVRYPQEIHSRPHETRVISQEMNMYENKKFEDNKNPSYDMKTLYNMRHLSNDVRSYSQDIRSSVQPMKLLSEVRLPSHKERLHLQDQKSSISSPQDYLKTIQYNKSTFEARMSNSINQAFNENQYIRPMNDVTQTYQDNRIVNDNKYSMDSSSISTIRNTTAPNEMKVHSPQYELHLVDHDGKKAYNRPTLMNDFTRKSPYDNKIQSTAGNNASFHNSRSGNMIENTSFKTHDGRINNTNYQPSFKDETMLSNSFKCEYMKKTDPNYARSINQYNVNVPSVDVPRSVPTDNRLQHLRINNTDNNFQSHQKEINKPYLEHKLSNSSTQIPRQEKQLAQRGSQQTNAHFTNYSENYRTERNDVSLPFHDMQASFNDIRPTFNQVNNLIQADSKTKHHHSVISLYEPRQNSHQNSTVNDKIIDRKLQDTKLELKQPYPHCSVSQSQHIAYSHHNQTPSSQHSYITSVAPCHTSVSEKQSYNTSDKNLIRSQIENHQNMLSRTSQNAYSRSYNYPSTPMQQQQQQQQTSEYNIPQNQYVSKSINHLQESQAYERQRLAAAAHNNSYQMLHKNNNFDATDRQNVSYNQNFRPESATNHSIPIQTFPIQENSRQIQQNPSSHSYQSTKSFIPTTKNIYRPSSQTYNQSPRQHEVIVTTGNVSTSQYSVYPTQNEHSLQQHHVTKGPPHYQQHTNFNSKNIENVQKRSHNLSPIVPTYSNTNYSTSKSSPLHNIVTQKHFNTNTPHLAFKTSEMSYKYPVSSAAATTVSQYHHNNGQQPSHSYITTNASMSTYTTTSVNTYQNSTASTSSNHHGNSLSTPVLQEDLIKRQQIHANSSLSSNQSRQITNNTSKGRTTTDLTVNVNKINSVSPLDLSVKTVRTSADSTANDDYQMIEHSSVEITLPHNYNLTNSQRIPTSRSTTVTGITPKVDFSPNFTHPVPTRPSIQKNIRYQSNSVETQLPTKPKYSTNKPYENRTAYYQNYHLQRHPIENPINKRINNSNIPEFSQNQSQYITQSSMKLKRGLEVENHNETHSHSKIPRVDNWRLSIDQQIDQRLLSYTHSKAQQEIQQHPVAMSKPLINGHFVPKSYPNDQPQQQQQQQQQQPSTYQTSNEQQSRSIDPKTSYMRSQNISPQYNSNPTDNRNYVQQHQTNVAACNLAQGNSSYNKLHPVGLSNNANSGADKRVISILRNSLEIKGAKEAQKRIEQERLSKTEINIQSYPQTDTTPVSTTTLVAPNNSNTAPTKFHLPRAVDSIKYNSGSSLNTTNILHENEIIDKSENKTINKISNADLDGLAANLAARIRTKAELKQVDPTQLAEMQKADNSQEILLPTSNNLTETITIPPTLTREQHIPVIPPRRRLFSRTEDDTGGTLIPHRNSILRSSSEASVFDFRESDSEGEMPILERQSLDDMRRDRKSLSKQPSTTNLTETTDVVVKSEIIETVDPFFTETCDKFLEQLRTGGSNKKRGRRKKVVEPEIIAKLENAMKNQQLVEIEIKVEKCDDIIKTEGERVEIIPPERNLDDFKINTVIKQEDSDSDVPLIRKKYKNVTSNDIKNEFDDDDDDDDDDEVLGVIKKKEKSGAKIKLESSSDSSDDSDNEKVDYTQHKETVAQRLRQRKCRSSEKRSDSETSTNNRTTDLTKRSKSVPQKKPSFGDGSDFRPGWEEEVYRYKQSLRMPVQLINIPRPSRLSTSLPDLDPCPSPTTSSIIDSDFFNHLKSFSHMKTLLGSNKIKREFVDSDLDSNFSFNLSKNIDDFEEATCSSMSSVSKTNQKENNSIVDVLAQRYGKNITKRSKKANSNRPKIIPKSSNSIELLPTPSLGIGSEIKEDERQYCKKNKNKKHCTDKTLSSNNSSNLLGFFRKKTVENFRDAFCKDTINEQFTPIIFKSRTRKETQVLKKRATMREVFGEDRPASAPPMTNHNELPSKPPLPVQKKKKPTILKVSSKSKKENTVPGRAGLRSAIVLRGHRSIVKTKRQIVNPNKKQLLKTLNAKKLRSDVKCSKTIADSSSVARKEKILKDQKQFKVQRGIKNQKLGLKSNSLKLNSKSVVNIKAEDKSVVDDKTVIKTEDINKDNKQPIKCEKDIKIENNDVKSSEITKITVKKKYKIKSIRRKFSSGFDYIRKKKKPLKKENIENEQKPKKRGILQRTNAATIQDIQREIKGWVLNKGIGETHLHRASRLGYTDITAYCLETLGNAPSPKDNAGYTPLHEACSRGHLDIAKLLLLYGANENEFAQGGIRPLHEASENGYVEIIRLLLSYGADPLFPTYSGLTPLSLATDNDTIAILQNYIADIQGKDAPPWIFKGPAQFFDPEEQGYDALRGAPSPDPSGPNSELDMEVCEAFFPNLYTLRGENPEDKWVLLQDLSNILKVKSKDALLRLLNQSPSMTTSNHFPSPPPVNHKSIVKEMKMADFLDQGHCCSLLSAGERVNIRASKISLVKYSDRVKELLNIEDFILPPTR